MLHILLDIVCFRWVASYESFSDVGESCVWWRADFQSGSRVLKKVFWTFSYLYQWHTMWFQCFLQGVRILLANHTWISPTSDNDSYFSAIYKAWLSWCLFTYEDTEIQTKICTFQWSMLCITNMKSADTWYVDKLCAGGGSDVWGLYQEWVSTPLSVKNAPVQCPVTVSSAKAFKRGNDKQKLSWNKPWHHYVFKGSNKKIGI